MEIMYGNMACEGIKSNNWKRMHGIPLKTKGRTENGYMVIPLNLLSTYISKRSKKKFRKFLFRRSINLIIESAFENKPDEKRIYHRYGYMKKKCKKKLRALNRSLN